MTPICPFIRSHFIPMIPICLYLQNYGTMTQMNSKVLTNSANPFEILSDDWAPQHNGC